MATHQDEQEHGASGNGPQGNGHRAATAEDIAGFITRAMLDDPPPRSHVDVYVPEFKSRARLQSLTNEEVERFGLKVAKRDGDTLEADNIGFRARYIAECWIDPETGEKLAGGEDDWRKIMRLRPRTVEILFTAAKKQNTLTESDLEAEVEALGKTPAAAG